MTFYTNYYCVTSLLGCFSYCLCALGHNRTGGVHNPEAGILIPAPQTLRNTVCTHQRNTGLKAVRRFGVHHSLGHEMLNDILVVD